MELPLFPLNTVLFPGATLPIHVFEERYKLLISHCLERRQPFGVVLIRSGNEVGGPAQPFDIGTTARIVYVQEMAEGRLNVISVGDRRLRILRLLHQQPYLAGEVELLQCDEGDGQLADLAATVAALFGEYYRLTLALSDQWARSVGLPQGAGPLSDFVASRLPVSVWVKQRLLETLSVQGRLEQEVDILGEAIRALTQRLAAARSLKHHSLSTLN